MGKEQGKRSLPRPGKEKVALALTTSKEEQNLTAMDRLFTKRLRFFGKWQQAFPPLPPVTSFPALDL